MPLTKDVNSFATSEEADLYFAERLDSALWDAATSTRKECALVTATGLLDSMSWAGQGAADAPLSFPDRVGTYLDPSTSRITALGPDYPKRLLKATYELAYHLLANEDVTLQDGTVSDISVGPVTLASVKNAPVIPDSVSRLIRPMLARGATNGWWRAN